MAALTEPRSALGVRPREASPPPDLPAHLAALEACDWAPREVAAALPAVLGLAETLEPQARIAWQAGLRLLHRRHGWALARESLEGMLELAAFWRDWPLVLKLAQGLEGSGELGIGPRRRLADACLNLGLADDAAEVQRSILLRLPGDEAAGAGFAEARRWRAFQGRVPAWVVEEGGELILEPLGHHHLGDFACQYYDPQIARLCCLPEFRNHDHWHHWLEGCWGYGDQLLFAVLHREWGFVGSVSLVLHGGVGFFYYWLGRDFQGQGWGPRAVALMLDMAGGRYGMHTCYAKVYDYNRPSRRALEKLGFEETGIRAAPPKGDELFYRRGEARSRQWLAREVHTLLERMGSDTVAAVPVV